MALKVGILGLPNVGKSSLFNAITQSSVAESANYPFCTIEPNQGVVTVPDERLEKLAKLSGSKDTIYSTITFVDIAGLVKGASKGEGLGNQFLSHVREADLLLHVLRCFEDDDITHVDGRVDPVQDMQTIELELIYADLANVEKYIANQGKRAKAADPKEKALLQWLERCQTLLSEGKRLATDEEIMQELEYLKQYPLLTAKPMLYVANVAESELNGDAPAYKALSEHLAANGDSLLMISAQLEVELASLDKEEAAEYLKDLGLEQSGLSRISQACFKALGLQCYFTSGEKESRSWTIPQGATAPQAAGCIHTDFETGFIRANIIDYESFVDCGGLKVAKEQGKLRQEGRDYIVQDGDVIEFLFNV